MLNVLVIQYKYYILLVLSQVVLCGGVVTQVLFTVCVVE